MLHLNKTQLWNADAGHGIHAGFAMSENEHTYTNGEITVIWKLHISKHCGISAPGLYRVFNPNERSVGKRGCGNYRTIRRTGSEMSFR